MGGGIEPQPWTRRGNRLFRRFLVALVALIWPPLGLLLAGMSARWAALLLLLPLTVPPAYWILGDHPRALALAAVAGGAGLVLLSLVSAFLAFRWAGREVARRPRSRLVALALLFVAAIVLGQVLLNHERQTRLEPFRESSVAMLPTLVPGDQFFVDKRKSSAAARGDVIVFRPPGGPSDPHVKRVVAIGGDTVETQLDQVRVNGVLLPHAPEGHGGPCPVQTSATSRGACVQETVSPGRAYEILLIDRPAESFGPRKLAPGELFVMGDNRNNSYDSRHFGPIRQEQVVGRLLVVWWSWWEGHPRPSRIGLVP